MIDLDQKGHIIGIEFVGQKDFSIRELLRGTPVQVPDEALNRTRLCEPRTYKRRNRPFR